MRPSCRHHIVNAFERTQQSSLLRLRPTPPNWTRQQRWQSSAAVAEAPTQEEESRSLHIPSRARHNELGVQQVSSHVHSQLFPSSTPKPSDPELVQLSKSHLAQHDLLGKTSDNTEPVGFDLPALQGLSMDEHFYRLGMDSAEPYLSLSKKFARASPPEKPRKWIARSGWTKYEADGSWQAIDAPDADVLSFDTEVMWRETSYPAMACAVSGTHWYAWLSPLVTGRE